MLNWLRRTRHDANADGPICGCGWDTRDGAHELRCIRPPGWNTRRECPGHSVSGYQPTAYGH